MDSFGKLFHKQYFHTKSHINKSVFESWIFFFILLFLPTQFGKHFWPSFSFVLGQRIDYLSPTLYVTDILIILLFISWGLRKVVVFTEERKKQRSIVPLLGGVTVSGFLYLLIILFIIFLTINISVSSSPIEGLYGLLKLLEIGFLTYYTGNIHRTKLKIMLLPLTFGIFSESILAIAQFFTQGSLGGFLYYLGERTFTSVTPGIANASINGQLLLRPYATFSHPNVLAGYLVIGMTLSSSMFLGHSSQIRKKLTIISLIIGTIGLCFTLSRVAIVVWFFVCVLLGFQYLQKRLFTKKILLIFNGVLLCLIVTLFIISPLLPRFSQLTLQDESVVLREQLSLDAFKMLFTYPFFGVGLHNFLPSLPHYDFARGSVFSIQPVHNIFLLVAAETGFLGVWLFVSFFIWMYLRLWKFYVAYGFKSFSSFGLILLTEIVTLGSFDHYFLTIQQGQLLLGLVIGMCLHFCSPPHNEI